MTQAHIFISGGARSGKTALAEKLALRLGEAPAYLATAEARDAEMAARIAAHRAARAERFTTIEEPLDLCGALAATARTHDAVLIDCLTLWLSNLLGAGRDIDGEIGALVATAEAIEATRIVFVSNEVGLGIVPENALAREFRDHAGRLNQAVAALAAHAYFTVSGLPLVLKGTPPDEL
ncbi:MAG: bifunctional adenosylcobinamide kinase/adenosylcobinamide-phosphate guanylyltransferase [Alphaproteobacteria bacterium]|nr:bifunctional adenosylcobinamide kinase/adenosylcobinamide-phosphate guanylyltransferase [Alphaproteobacteria bacterium]